MASTGINDAPGVLNSDGVRTYVGGVPNPVDRDLEIRTDIQKSNNNVIDTGPKVGLAKEERIGDKLWTRAVEIEQRAKFIRSLIQNKVGTNRIECNQVKSRRELRRDSGRRVKEILEE